ncbi:MAG: hypothetical protein NTV43_06590 [Methylococcales bacterium]|nr:hypothetical protein [Methylococcales bacterium]
MINQPDFFPLPPLDLENKLLLPTAKLYGQATMQLTALYQDIRTALVNAHTIVANTAKQVYEHPIETMTAWYDQAVYSGISLYAQAQSTIVPVYQGWQVKVNMGKERAGQNLQAFWDNPEQMAAAAFEPVTRYVASASGQTERYWQLLTDRPEQFFAAVFTPIGHYMAELADTAEAGLISAYHLLANAIYLMLAKPSETIQALYHNGLSALLDAYFGIVSSLLAMT